MYICTFQKTFPLKKRGAFKTLINITPKMFNFLISKRTLKFVKKEYQAQPKNVKVFENIVLLTFLIMISFDSTVIEP